MKKSSLLLLCLSWIGIVVAFDRPVTPVVVLPDYYASIDGENGKGLLDAIQQVAKIGYRADDFRYDSVWLAFKYTDLRTDGYVWEIYSDCTFEYEKDRTSTTSQTGECKGYNREHAMCQSWFGTTSLAGKEMSSSKKNSPGSDIFHIYPTAYGMNSRRGNRPYGEVSQSNYTSGNGSKYGDPVATMSVANSVAGSYMEGTITSNTNVFEPADEYKGDIARSYFGTMVKWAGEWAFNKNEYGKVIFDATIDADTHYGPENNYGFTDYGLALMLSWHRQDPVSQKEVDRNNGIQITQGNRNPFIDYPYLVEYIWGERSGDEVKMEELLCSADPRFELGVSNGYMTDLEKNVMVDTVCWMHGNNKYMMTPVRRGNKVNKLPKAPASCSERSNMFVGWTDEPISAYSEEAPKVLYQKADQIPAVNGNICYYAVFVEPIDTGTQRQTITFNPNSSEGWTLNDLIASSDKSYWIMPKNASIVSPQIAFNQLDSIVMQLRTYYNYGTIQIAADGDILTTIEAISNSITRYTYVPSPLEKTTSLTFTSIEGTETRGVGVREIAIYLSEGEIIYTNYITHCDEASYIDNVVVKSVTDRRKILLNGCLYIQIDGQLYDSMGMIVK